MKQTKKQVDTTPNESLAVTATQALLTKGETIDDVKAEVDTEVNKFIEKVKVQKEKRTKQFTDFLLGMSKHLKCSSECVESCA